MINTVLFDLDGTLLQFAQEDFISVYFTELKKVFVRLGVDAELGVRATWAGTKAMILNDGGTLNSQRFWSAFSAAAGVTGDRLREVEDACDGFYTREFDTVRSVLKNTDPGLPRRLVSALKSRGFGVVLATNPLFPTCAVTTRLSWVGLTPDDFLLVTDYSCSTFCKPNPGYYREIFSKLGKTPGECLMVGNNAREDMCAGELGAETYLVTDYLENEDKLDVSAFRRGALSELEAFLTSLPTP